MPRYHATVDGNVPFTPEEETAANAEVVAWDNGAAARAEAKVQADRRAAYEAEADHLHFEEARGEVSDGTWAAKVAEIKGRFPKS